MNIQSFDEVLPEVWEDPLVYINALRKRWSSIVRKKLFENEDFVKLFERRVSKLVNDISGKKEQKKHAEIELAYIYKELSDSYSLVFGVDPEFANLRTTELILEKEGLFDYFIAFSEWKASLLKIDEPEMFALFLKYLMGYAKRSYAWVYAYLRSCVGVSQVEGWLEALLLHLKERWDTIPQDIIDSMVEENGYVWWKQGDFDAHIRSAMEDDNLSYDEALDYVEAFQEDSAAFHFYLTSLWNEYIMPHLDTIGALEREKISSLITDLKDLIDPESYIPYFFFNGNFFEHTLRRGILEEWRDVH